MARFEMVATESEFRGQQARLHLHVCASSPDGRPVGEFVEVAVSPWFDVSNEAGAMRWFFDWYRDRQGFAHPEDPQGASGSPGVGVAVMVGDLVTGDMRVHRNGSRAELH